MEFYIRFFKNRKRVREGQRVCVCVGGDKGLSLSDPREVGKRRKGGRRCGKPIAT